MRLLLATSNPDKVAEWRRIAPGVEWEVDPSLPSPDETGATCAENARLKARAAWLATGRRALGDDVGLWVEALGGGPGVDLKPWAESLGGWEAARAALAAVAGSRAVYRCGLALCGPTARNGWSRGWSRGGWARRGGAGRAWSRASARRATSARCRSATTSPGRGCTTAGGPGAR